MQKTETNTVILEQGEGITRTRQRILRAACELFFQKGYDNTSQREIAARIGIKAGSLYNHFPGKEDILYSILFTTISDLTAGVEEEIGKRRDPVDRLKAAGTFHTLFHTQRREEAVVWNTEARAIKGDKRDVLVGMRDRYQELIESVIGDGVRTGDFEVKDIKLVTYAIINMWNSVAKWYKPGGRLSPEEVARVYVDLALAMLKAG